jgi:transcriptional regulator with XRE-family HTH domain
MIRLRINEIAKSKGLNQSQLQIKAGVTPQLLNRYWHSHTQSVAFEPLEKIAKALGVNPGYLLVSDEMNTEGAGEEEPNSALATR